MSSPALPTVLVVGGSTIATQIVSKKPAHQLVRTVIASFFLGAFVSLLSSWNGQVAQSFCVLIGITAVLVNGATLFSSIGKVLG